MRVTGPRALPRRSLAVAWSVVLLAGCGQGSQDRPDPADSVEPPEDRACRVLTPEDVAARSNATPPVSCEEPHTAQTILVDELPEDLADVAWDDERLGAFAYRSCSDAFMDFLEADESTVLRTVLSWAWFRPSEAAWDDGARWYRCDLVGGGEQTPAYLELPADAEGMLEGLPPDRWMACVAGPSVAGAPRTPCSEEHDWRAVTTIKVGDKKAPYPGDRLVEVTSRDYCQSSVGYWLDFPESYDFAYTRFHEAEWKLGNRRSICWVKTPT
ncbi:septum formation family protein [Nocardioides dongkuii]|uniref:septum formation family protein n=1 Tax=Nocardioides dongkuii TaxID=2760089 RepID=UPI0015FDBBE6|nr:septum formation family protein [Nocardioides dongkuii]